MKPKAILVAGPQASGKSLAIKWLSQLYDVKAWEEPATFVFKKYKVRGAINSKNFQRKIWEIDIQQLTNLDEEKINLLDNNFVNFAFYWYHNGITPQSLRRIEIYLDRLENIDLAILFLDTNPEISFERKKEMYRKRGYSEEEIESAKRIIYGVYPFIKTLVYGVAKGLEVPLYQIDNKDSLEEFKQNVIKGFECLVALKGWKVRKKAV